MTRLSTRTLSLFSLLSLACSHTGGPGSAPACPKPTPCTSPMSTTPSGNGTRQCPQASTRAASLTSVALAQTEPTPANGTLKPRDCSLDISPQLADAMYREAVVLIERVGEHPSNADLDLVLPLLEASARSGHAEAQRRFGSYVVGYWVTDEMFWPSRRKTAIAALAMLYESVRLDPAASDAWAQQVGSGKATIPTSPGLPLPKAWVSAALREAKQWEHCHPSTHP